MPKFSIIIPVCGNAEITKNCLDSVRENSSDFEVIIIENGSTLAFRDPEIVIRNEKNLGFPIAVNQGIKAATGEIIVILNNDTIVTPGWLACLEYHLKTFDLVGPVTNNISGPQQVSCGDLSDKTAINAAAQAIYEQKACAIYPWHRLVFFCVAIKREVIDKIGLLDEQFSPGNFEDDDYCLRAIEAGFRLGLAEDIFIYHVGSATHKSENIDFQNLMETNRAKFLVKWPEWKYLSMQNKCPKNCLPAVGEKRHSLALVMIVKNEEKGLARAIESCLDFVDEIVISVDSASTDKTFEIAKQYTDVVKIHHWRDDFSEARNFAHEGVKSDWILFLDGHEYVEKSPQLAEHLALDCDGLLCTVEMESGMQFRNPRIYKNGVQFFGAYHEIQRTTKLFPYIEFLVKHDRAGGQALSSALKRDAQKEDQMPRILGAQIKKNPHDHHALFHLALYYQGHRQFRKALKLQKRTLKISLYKGERWYVLFNRALCRLSMGQYLRAFWTLSLADDEVPGRWETAKLRGIVYMSARKYQKAIESFVDSFKINTGDSSYKPWPRDEGGTWNLIGECFFNINQYFQAHVAFLEASKKVTDDKFKEFLQKRAQLMLTIANRFTT